MLLIAILVGGMAVGALAQLMLGRAGTRIDWTMALISGIGGSFIGGFIGGVLAGEGLSLRPSGVVGSIAGAVLMTAIWIWVDPVKNAEAKQSRPRSRR